MSPKARERPWLLSLHTITYYIQILRTTSSLYLVKALISMYCILCDILLFCVMMINLKRLKPKLMQFGRK